MEISRLQVKDIMSENVTCLNQNHRVRQAKEILRIKRISGVPIVDSERRIQGIFSVEDLIKVLETDGPQGLEKTISDIMTKRVITVKDSDFIGSALLKFRKYNFGRLPVVDKEDKVVGILTLKDIVIKFSEILKIDYYQGEETKTVEKRQEELLDEKAGISLEYPIIGGDFSMGGKASSDIKKTLRQLGVDPKIQKRVSIAAYEAEMNIIIHAYKGSISVKIDSMDITIVAKDEGPGIEDIDKAMEEGFSTASDYIREMGFGAGMGLPNMKRCSDDFKIESKVNIGTIVTMVIHLN